MSIHLKNGNVVLSDEIRNMDLWIDQARVWFQPPSSLMDQTIDCTGLTITPGLIDPHVHFREPGYCAKETIATGSYAAAHGGYTTVMTMPNLDPVPDDINHLKLQLDLIQSTACIHVIPYGSISVNQKGMGRLSDMRSMKDHVVGFSDDGVGVQDETLMLQAMKTAVALNKPIVAHCEANALLTPHGCIHDGHAALRFGYPGISSASEYTQIQRDIELARLTHCHYHVCHVSTKESVALIKKAKKEGVNISCEVTPHHLLLNEDDIHMDDGRFKMNPPLRSKADQQALLNGLLDGTIDCIATDHAPHTMEEKSKGLYGSAMGIVGLETSFPLLFTYLVKTNILTLHQLIDKMSTTPSQLFQLDKGVIQDGTIADLAIFDLNHHSSIDPSSFYSKGRSTPFEHWDVDGKTIMTMVDGKILQFDPEVG